MTYRTRAFHALAHDFRIEAESPEVAQELEMRDEERVVARDLTVGGLAGEFVHHVNQRAISGAETLAVVNDLAAEGLLRGFEAPGDPAP